MEYVSALDDVTERPTETCWLDVSATLFVVNEAWRPGAGIMVRLTDPENPPRLASVISDVDWIPT
jgi:hypothetical protein